MGFVEPYHLAIDVGTSRVAAAVSRLGADGRIATLPVPLGRRGDTVSTVAFVAEDGSLLFGDAAERRGVSEPERLIREFKRSIGDDVPFVVAGHVIAPERLYAETVATVVDTVSDREGSAPEGIVLTHPVTWGAHRLGVVHDALAAVGLGGVELLNEPEAAARHYEAGRPLETGQAVAVYDLGGGTFDAVVLRRESDGSFRILGRPEGLGDLGGADFDDRVMRHAIGMAEVAPEHLTIERDDSRLALAQLRRECVDAKEALSYDSDATIPVLLQSGSPSVRLTRSEFESMIDSDIARTVDALDDALASAGIDAAELDCILLIGGSSRIPLVTQRLSERFDRPLAIDADPKSSIALGAARTGLVRAADVALGVSDTPSALSPEAEVVEDAESAPEDAGPRPAPVARTTPGERERMSRPHLVALAGGTLFFIAAVVFSTSEAAGLLPEQTIVASDPAASGLTFVPESSEPDAPAVQSPVAAVVPPALMEPVSDVRQADEPAATYRPKATPRSSTSPTTTNARADSDSSGGSFKNPKAADPTPSTPTGTGQSGSTTPTETGSSETGNGSTSTGTTGNGSTSTGTTGGTTGGGSTPSESPSPSPSTGPDPEPSTPPETQPPTTTPPPEPEPEPEPSASPSSEPSESPVE